MGLFSPNLWTISCRRYYSGWATQQTSGGAGHTQQSSGDREADWQGPQVTCGRELNRGRHLGSLISWPSPAPGRSGPALAQVPAPAPGASASWLTAALWQVNEMRGEAISKGSSSKSLVSREAGGNYSSYLPLGSQARLSQAVQAGTRTESPQNSRCCRLGHKQQLGTCNGATVGGVQRKWLGLGRKVGLEGKHPGASSWL